MLRDGTIKHLHTVGKPQIEESGAVVEYIGVTMDETERVRANAAMHEAQAELARVARLTTLGELDRFDRSRNQPAFGSDSRKW